MSSRVKISVKVTIELNKKKIKYSVRPKENSVIYKQGLLDKEDMPENFYESHGFMRSDGFITDKGSLREVLSTINAILPLYFSISQGAPILWICSKNHTVFYRSIIKKYKDISFVVLRGSLRKDNPYKLLEMDWGKTGGSKDEHIIMLTKKDN